MQANVWMQAEELANPLGLVRREVVQDDVDLFLRRPARSHSGQEGDELLTGVTGHGLAHAFEAKAADVIAGVGMRSGAADGLCELHRRGLG